MVSKGASGARSAYDDALEEAGIEPERRMHEEDIMLAKVHGDLYHWQHVLRAREKKATRVRNRITSRRELNDRASFLWVTLRIVTGRCDWRTVAKTARRIAYLADGFYAEEQVPNARARVEECQRLWDQVKPKS